MHLLLRLERWQSIRFTQSLLQCPRRRRGIARRPTVAITQRVSRRTTTVALVQQRFCGRRHYWLNHPRQSRTTATQPGGRRIIGRPLRGAVQTVRCTTCTVHRHNRGRLHVHTRPLRIRCRMTASVHTCTAHRHSPGGGALVAGCRSRDICSCRLVFDWAAKCTPPNRAFPGHTPCRSPCRAESHRAPTKKAPRVLHPQCHRDDRTKPARHRIRQARRVARGDSSIVRSPTASRCTVTAGIGTAHSSSGGS